MMQRRNLVAAVCLSLAVMVSPAALAHGDAVARHGGVVAQANDIGFELVAQAAGASIYLFDHDKPLATAGLSGKLTVLDGPRKTEAPLLAAGGNQLLAKGLALPRGAKVVAVLGPVGGETVSVRFKLK